MTDTALTTAELQRLLTDSCRPETLAALAADMINARHADAACETLGDLAAAALSALVPDADWHRLMETERRRSTGA